MAKLHSLSIASYHGTAAADSARSGGSIAARVRRLMSAAWTTREERIDLEIGRRIEAHGGRMSDDLERQIDLIVRSHGGC